MLSTPSNIPPTPTLPDYALNAHALDFTHSHDILALAPRSPLIPSVPSCCPLYSSHPLFFWLSGTSVHLPVRFWHVSPKPDAVKEVRLVSVNGGTRAPRKPLTPHAPSHPVLSFGACMQTSGWMIMHFPTRLDNRLRFPRLKISSPARD
jgi:hypothetical protein